MDTAPADGAPHPQGFTFAAPSPRFFRVARLEKPSPIKRVKHDVPALVVPTPYEARRAASKTPRQPLLTLPPIKPSRSSVGPHTSRSAASGCSVVSTMSKQDLRNSVMLGSLQATPRPGALLPVTLPKLTFSTAAPLSSAGPLAPSARRKVNKEADFETQLTEYVDHDEENDTRRFEAAERGRDEINTFEQRHVDGNGMTRGQKALQEHHTVTSIDEEASTRVLKVMFQLNLTRNSGVISRLKELDNEYLQRKVVQELGYKKQMSRDEFYVLLCKVLKDDFLNKRDCLTLFSVFDDDKSGLVDAVEFVSGFMTLVAAGENDIAFKFIHTVLDSRGEKTIVNAFISRFELQLLVGAAQHNFASDRDIVELLGKLPSSFNFSHHLGRIPIMQLREKIVNDEDLFAIFSALPNPSKPAKEAADVAAAEGQMAKDDPTAADGTSSTHANAAHQHMIADMYMVQNVDEHPSVEEHDAPNWWVSGGIVYKSSESNPYPEPVFLKDADRRSK